MLTLLKVTNAIAVGRYEGALIQSGSTNHGLKRFFGSEQSAVYAADGSPLRNPVALG